MKEITVEKRIDDFHASLKSNPNIWGIGDSKAEAIGNMMLSYSKEFNLTINMLNP